MKHPCLPQTMTTDNLAEWIKSNNVEVIPHVERTNLDEEAVHELANKSSLASRALDRLEEIKKKFNEVIKEGTPGTDDEGNPNEPYTVTIPPTKGTKVLKANRHYADQQIENGYSEENIPLHMIPYPEESKFIAVDLLGNVWPEFNKEMSADDINKYKPLLREDKPKKEKKQKSFMEEPPVDSSSLDL